MRDALKKKGGEAPEPPAPPRSIIEDRFSAQLIRAATFSGSPATGVQGLIVKASIEIVDKVDRKRALFDVTTLGGGFSVGPFKGGGSVTLGAGPVKDFKTFRLLGSGSGNISLKSFEGAVTVFVDIAAGVATKSKGALSDSHLMDCKPMAPIRSRQSSNFLAPATRRFKRPASHLAMSPWAN